MDTKEEEELKRLTNFYKDCFKCLNFDQLKKSRRKLLDQYNDKYFVNFFSKDFLDKSLAIIDSFLLRKEMNLLDKSLNQKG